MKTLLYSFWIPLVLLAIFLPNQVWSDDQASVSDDSAATGESGSDATNFTTNRLSFALSAASTNTATPSTALPANSSIPPPSPPPSHVATLAPSDLREFAMQSPQVQRLITKALALTTLNLNYKYGSSDPANGGMDCSGTVYYLLKGIGIKDVPRDASEMYKWVWLRSRFQAVTSLNPDTFELAPLQPGDLLFWTGTYAVDRDPPVTHVMIYLGINRHTGKRVMVGASEGRRFNGKSQYGVSVFDFEMPGKRSKDPAASGTNATSRFIGYGSIPGLAEVDGGPENNK